MACKCLKNVFSLFKKAKPTYKAVGGDIRNSPITFNQVFFLYILYQWMLQKPCAANNKMEINSLIALNHCKLQNRYKFPNNSFGDFQDMNNIPVSKYLNGLYGVKEREMLILNSSLSFILTDDGKKIVEIVKRGNYYEYDFFDSSVKYFNQNMIDDINNNISILKTFSDNTLITTALQMMRQNTHTHN